MTTWTLMKDAKPVASYEFDGKAPSMMNEEHAYPIMDFLVHQGAPAIFVPITDGVAMVGGNWSGEGIWQLVREGSQWLSPGQVRWNFRLPQEAA